MVNDAIDTPFSGTKFFDALLSDETYLAQYHAYLRQLVDEYVNGGRFDEVYTRIRNQIDALVETDPTAFYSYDAYQTAAQTLYDTVKLRAQSIDGQLDGSIPSTDDGQRADSSALIDASQIDVKAMGQFNMGGFGGSEKESGSETESTAPSDGTTEKPTEDTTSARPETAEMENASANDPENGRQRPSFPGMSEQSASRTRSKNLTIFGICFAAVLALLLILKRFKRK